MFDLELLKTFVCVVDAGGFTRAGERVNRTQSTVSQQIRKLEEQVARPLLLRQRAGKSIQLTEDGERLLGYARRLVGLAQEASVMMQASATQQVIRLGVPDDFDVNRLIPLLTDFARRFPSVRLDTLNGLSIELQAQLETRELDLALIKRRAGDGVALAAWPEQLHWVAGRQLDLGLGSLPLVVFAQGCLYRDHAIHSLEACGRDWHIAFASQSLISIQAAVSANLGISLLPATALQNDHCVLKDIPGLDAPPPTELALVSAKRLLPLAQQHLVDYLIEQLQQPA